MSKKINMDKLANLEKIGEGACAEVYKFRDYAIKVFKSTGQVPDYNNLQDLIGTRNGTCIFPLDLMEDLNGNNVGYIMQYIDGTKLDNVISEIDFETLQSALQNVEQDFRSLSEDRIVLNDFNVGNVLWDKNSNSMKIIDTDFYQKNNSLTQEEVYKYNQRRFNSEIETIIGIRDGELIQFLNSSGEFQQFHKDYLTRSFKGENVSVSEMLEQIRNVAEQRFNIRFSNLGEIKNAILTQTKDEHIDENDSYSSKTIPIFEPPVEIEEDSKPSFVQSVKQRVAGTLSKFEILKKIPFMRKFIDNNEVKMLENPKTRENNSNIKSHSEFADELSGHGKYRFLGRPVKLRDFGARETNELEPHAMADDLKISRIESIMAEKSINDD